jgi:hypothetical protein
LPKLPKIPRNYVIVLLTGKSGGTKGKEMLKEIDAIEAKLDGVLLVNLIKVLEQLDVQITNARSAARATGDFSEIQAMNTVRTAVINKIDEQDPNFYDSYVSARVGA